MGHWKPLAFVRGIFGGVCLGALCLGVVVGSVSADGKFFARGATTPPTIPGQQAIIVFDGTQQTLVIDTEVLGDAPDVAWVIPVPSVPTVTATTRGTIATCAHVTSDLPIRRSPTSTMLVVCALIVLVPAAVFTLVESRRARLEAILLLLVGALVALLLLPALGTARARMIGADAGVIVHEEGRAGEFDFSVIGGEDAAAMAEWLRVRGFVVSNAAERVIGEYVAEGWVFVAGRREAAAAQRAAAFNGVAPPHPIVLRFEATEPVYPMRLTGADEDGEVELRLFVFADRAAENAVMETIACLPVRHVKTSTTAGERLAIADRPAGVAMIGHAGLLDLIGDATTLTRLDATLTPAQMRSDIRFQWSTPSVVQRRVARVGPRSGVDPMSIGIATIGILIAAAALSLVSLPMRLRAIGAIALVIVGLGVIVASESFLAHDAAAARVQRQSAAQERNADSIVDWLQASDAHHLPPEAMILAAKAHTHGPNLRNPLVRGVGRLRDAPGDGVVEVSESRIVYRWFDATGASFTIDLTERLAATERRSSRTRR